jgi:hypothetical protein
MPTKIGKKIARYTVGSIVPYRGGLKSPNSR